MQYTTGGRHARLEEADRVGELGGLLGAEELGEAVGEDRGDGDVGEGDALADEEGVGGEVGLEDTEGLDDGLDAVLEDLERDSHHQAQALYSLKDVKDARA